MKRRAVDLQRIACCVQRCEMKSCKMMRKVFDIGNKFYRRRSWINRINRIYQKYRNQIKKIKLFRPDDACVVTNGLMKNCSSYLVLPAAGAAPRPLLARHPVDAGVGEGDRVHGSLAADDDALEAVRRDAGGDDNVPLVAAAAAPRPDLDEPHNISPSRELIGHVLQPKHTHIRKKNHVQQ